MSKNAKDRRAARALVGAAIATLILAGASVAGAAIPNPDGAPGCKGNIVATTNQNSGTNANNARGPGYFFRNGQVVKEAIGEVRSIC